MIKPILACRFSGFSRFAEGPELRVVLPSLTECVRVSLHRPKQSSQASVQSLDTDTSTRSQSGRNHNLSAVSFAHELEFWVDGSRLRRTSHNKLRLEDDVW